MLRRTACGSLVISHWVYLSLLPRSSGCKDELFAAIATKIIEFAGLDDKADRACKLQDKATRPRCFHTQVKIWMGTVHSEIANITNRQPQQCRLVQPFCAGYAKDVGWLFKFDDVSRLEQEPADFVLVDHSKVGLSKSWKIAVLFSTSLDLAWRSANQPLQGFKVLVMFLLVLCFCCNML